jgi:hypothetical protein
MQNTIAAIRANHPCTYALVADLRAWKSPAYEKLDSLRRIDELTPPYVRFLGAPSYEVCRCCGFEFGNDDDPGTAPPASFKRIGSRMDASGLILRAAPKIGILRSNSAKPGFGGHRLCCNPRIGHCLGRINPASAKALATELEFNAGSVVLNKVACYCLSAIGICIAGLRLWPTTNTRTTISFARMSVKVSILQFAPTRRLARPR